MITGVEARIPGRAGVVGGGEQRLVAVPAPGPALGSEDRVTAELDRVRMPVSSGSRSVAPSATAMRDCAWWSGRWRGGSERAPGRPAGRWRRRRPGRGNRPGRRRGLAARSPARISQGLRAASGPAKLPAFRGWPRSAWIVACQAADTAVSATSRAMHPIAQVPNWTISAPAVPEPGQRAPANIRRSGAGRRPYQSTLCDRLASEIPIAGSEGGLNLWARLSRLEY